MTIRRYGGSSAAGSKTSVNSTTSSVQVASANPDRVGVSVQNTDENSLYLDLSGGTASSTSHTVEVPSGAYYEAPFGYKGSITGAWSADGSGSALVTEFT